MKPTFQTIRGLTGPLSKAGLAEGTNANTFKIAATDPAGVHFAIEGLAYYKANTDNLAFSAGSAVADLSACLFLVQINAAGTVSTKQGNAELSADLANGKVALHAPEADADKAPLGLIKVVTSGGTFTPGSTDLGAASVTDTYYDYAVGGIVRPIEA